MANYTYTRTLNTPAAKKAGLDAIKTLFDHLPYYKATYNIDFVSCTWNDPTLQLTLTAELPANEEVHCGIV